jgi:DNA mismatch repair protein MutL
VTIRVLPPEIANRIAAGEVVERPASVIKELIENAIDAGARDISIEIVEGGRRLMRVSDDGGGIAGAEVEVAFARHATSKLQSVEDLEHIGTLGFRGEALASIAAVSRLTLTTRTEGEEAGARLELDGGWLARREAIGRPRGTSISVEHLFYNVPARLKFLRAAVTEAGHIHELVTVYAMAYPNLRFTLQRDGKPVFRSNGAGELRDVLLSIYGAEVFKQMLPLRQPEEPEPGFALNGYIGLPALHRPGREQMIFFVNGRWIHDRNLSYAVVQAYHTWLPVGRFPMSVLMLQMEPAEVDVNVHPTKAEVRFRQPGKVFGLVQRQVRATLVTQAPAPTVDAWGPPVSAGWDWSRRQALTNAGASGRVEATQGELEGTPAAVAPERLPPLRVIGQIREMYVIAEGPTGLYLIDQHAAHERILYERLQERRANGEQATQPLLQPVTVTWPGRRGGLLAEHAEALRRVGFDLEPFGENAFLLRGAPADFDLRADPLRALEDILVELEGGEKPLEREKDAALMAAVCKRLAVKAGQTLTLDEMASLIRQLEATHSPRTCPHGRPTMIHLSAETLERQFSRT